MLVNDFPVTFSIFKKKCKNQENAFDFFKRYNARFYYSGSCAIWNVIKAMPLEKTDVILMPAYHCGIEIDAVLKAGLIIKFYKIDITGKADLDDIKNKLDNKTKAIFLIHYFGFSQPIEEIMKICAAYNLYLIEDCAHALFSNFNGKPLGLFGDASIFSIKKSLPVPNGGAAFFNKIAAAHQNNAPINPSVIVLLKENINMILLAGQIKFQILGRLIRLIELFYRLLGKLLRTGRPKVMYDYRVFDCNKAKLTMSYQSKWIMKGIDINTIIQKRRNNFLFLLSELENEKYFESLYKTLPEGICPLFYPILIKNRNVVYEKLLKKGIKTFIFGKKLHDLLPIKEFSEAMVLSEMNLCLPIHQEVNEEKLKYLVRVLRSFN